MVVQRASRTSTAMNPNHSDTCNPQYLMQELKDGQGINSEIQLRNFYFKLCRSQSGEPENGFIDFIKNTLFLYYFTTVPFSPVFFYGLMVCGRSTLSFLYFLRDFCSVVYFRVIVSNVYYVTLLCVHK